jgi:hypothetical protein
LLMGGEPTPRASSWVGAGGGAEGGGEGGPCKDKDKIKNFGEVTRKVESRLEIGIWVFFLDGIYFLYFLRWTLFST